jgi:GntR family transcriptional regulator
MGSKSLALVRTAAPLYRDVAAALERAIREGVWKAGEQIPTEPELECRFGASRGTIRQAIGALVQQGWLHRQAGRGTFVLGPSFESLERYFRYETLPGSAHLVPRNRVLDQAEVAADVEVAAAFGITPGAPVAWLRRLRCNDEEPFLLVDSHFPMPVWQVVKGADFTHHPLYDLFKNSYGQFVIAADEFLRADLASPGDAALLGIAAGDPVIRIERTARSFEDRPIEYRRAGGRADRFRYHVRLR